ncbi:hypothetical protein [Burkholderia glumae]|uniref:hypothetical protein n=1 Tax=Burkholderia glumae TaxID=337 RepID=UPI0012FDBA9F|nr:hypothetical protein [Burkholderia glumae]QHE09821.1 hypothetical protein GQR88_05085 [Burkholderia glumae AU6208]
MILNVYLFEKSHQKICQLCRQVHQFGLRWQRGAAAVVAFFAAVIAAIIAWRQYRVAKAKLNLDLFERRYELFLIVWKFLSSVVQGGMRALNSEQRIKMTNSIPKMEFLFGRDVANYVVDVNQKSVELWSIERATATNNDVMPPEHIRRHTELMTWFSNEALAGARKRFGVYLDFEKWK